MGYMSVSQTPPPAPLMQQHLQRAHLLTALLGSLIFPHSLIPGAHRRHHGPQDSGVTKGPKKKGATKKSTQRCELLFGSTDGMSSMIQPCCSTELTKDTRTSVEKAALMAWVRPPPALFPSPPSNCTMTTSPTGPLARC
jgi:hypothetical protein